MERSAREVLFETIQASAVTDDDLEGGVLVGFLVIAEWRAPDGNQWLSKISGDHSAALPTWRQRGYAGEVVHDMWADNSEREPGEDED